MEQKRHKTPTTHSLRRFAIIGGITLLATVPLMSGLLYIVDKTYDFSIADSVNIQETTLTSTSTAPTFPIGVVPLQKLIVEQDNVEEFMYTHITKTKEIEEIKKISLLRKTISKLALFDWYQNLAAGASRILIIEPGERREEIASNFGKILKWSEDEKREFLTSVISSDPVLLEGKFIPGSYIVARDAKPEVVSPLIIERFNTEVMLRYGDAIEANIPLNDIVTIASLLEREAYDFEDMRYIAGVIWNRLFIDMNLQIDATLQYAKGTASVQSWWPKPVPDDKYIDSPFNTYQNEGLPPTPIANPSTLSILAALNPRQTDCFYYFHDADGGFHCSPTYKEHVENLKKYYGRGK